MPALKVCQYNKNATSIEKKRQQGMSFETARRLVTGGQARANDILEERGIRKPEQESVLNSFEVVAEVQRTHHKIYQIRTPKKLN